MNKYSLKTCIKTLEKVRDTHNSQLDTSVLSELDEVIIELRKLRDDSQSNVEVSGMLSSKALKVISDVINIFSNFTDLM